MSNVEQGMANYEVFLLFVPRSHVPAWECIPTIPDPVIGFYTHDKNRDKLIIFIATPILWIKSALNLSTLGFAIIWSW